MTGKNRERTWPGDMVTPQEQAHRRVGELVDDVSVPFRRLPVNKILAAAFYPVAPFNFRHALIMW
jgi:hypothetical protein